MSSTLVRPWLAGRWPILLLVMAVVVLGCGGGPADAPPSPEETTKVVAGDPAPPIDVELLDGTSFRLEDHRGEVVVVSFFATWCPPCREELPHVENELWRRFRDRGLTVVAVAREETSDVVRPFIEEHGFTFPVAVDPDRTNYARYADAYIPRLVVVGRDGVILHHASGFEAEEFDDVVSLVEAALASTTGAT